MRACHPCSVLIAVVCVALLVRGGAACGWHVALGSWARVRCELTGEISHTALCIGVEDILIRTITFLEAVVHPGARVCGELVARSSSV